MADITRQSILAEAERCVCGDRDKQYGPPEDSFGIIAAFWETYLRAMCVSPGADVLVEPEDVAIMMGLLKIGRIASGQSNPDNYVDLAGYAACAGEVALRQND